MTETMEQRVLEALGEDGLRALVGDFYARIPADPLLLPMYPEDDLAGAEERLADFLVFRLGGSQRYLEQRGHPRLRMRHAPFAIDSAARDAWLANMRAALAARVADAEVRALLDAFLEQVATFLVNRPG